MRVFVGEFLCGGGMASTPLEQISPSLLNEGRAMWHALVTDLAAWANVLTPLDARLNDLADDLPRNVQRFTLNASADLQDAWLDAARACDVAIVVAPETDGELHRLVTLFRESGVKVLAVDETVIRMTTDKWLTALWLDEHGIATPATWTNPRESNNGAFHKISRRGSVGLDAKRWVRKPRDGCGSDSIRVFDDRASAGSNLQSHEIMQAWVEGRPASILVVGGMTCATSNRVPAPIVCPVMWQHCDWDAGDSARTSQSCPTSICYRGGSGPIEPDLQSRGRALADQVLQAMPKPPRGFLGIDLLLGDRPEDDCVIEINPRLTTSYIGVRELASQNLTSIWNSPERLNSPGAIDTGHCNKVSSERPFGCSSDQVRWTVEGDVHVVDHRSDAR
ncbi:MAG: ATP-grasp domain-containing protein [Rhodopirellula sp. JB055]|uniref:ATP-grasp domain-containing protein n=1 Tax=Rhodopirellula sp. JB055 TaxID=3342846 RepID=UPI00370A0EFE